jgi:hypothetical protein
MSLQQIPPPWVAQQQVAAIQGLAAPITRLEAKSRSASSKGFMSTAFPPVFICHPVSRHPV